MVDSNLIILGALAAGGYYAMFVYEWPSAGDIAGGIAGEGMAVVEGVIVEVAEEVEGGLEAAGQWMAKVTQPLQCDDVCMKALKKGYAKVCHKKGETCAVGSSCNQCCNTWEWVGWTAKCTGTESEEKKERAEAKKALDTAVAKTCKKKDEYCLVGSSCNFCCNSWDWWGSGAHCN